MSDTEDNDHDAKRRSRSRSNGRERAYSDAEKEMPPHAGNAEVEEQGSVYITNLAIKVSIGMSQTLSTQ